MQTRCSWPDKSERKEKCVALAIGAKVGGGKRLHTRVLCIVNVERPYSVHAHKPNRMNLRRCWQWYDHSSLFVDLVGSRVAAGNTKICVLRA